MHFENPRHLATLVLDGEPLARSDLEELIRRFPEEHTHHEYKTGAWTAKDAERGSQRGFGRPEDLRRYVTSFANGDGGVLVLGVDESEPRRLRPCVDSNPIWIERSLQQQLAGRLVPWPVMQTVDIGTGEVVVIAIARSPQLLSVIEKGETKYFLRCGESTLEIPDYLLSDLLLGRRQHPILTARATVSPGHRGDPEPGGPQRVTLNLAITLENQGLVEAKDPTLHLVLPKNGEGGVPRPLRPYLDVRGGEASWVALKAPKVPSIPILEEIKVVFRESLLMNPDTTSKAFAGLCVIPKGSPPIWFQLQLQLWMRQTLGEPERDLAEVSVERAVGPVTIAREDHAYETEPECQR